MPAMPPPPRATCIRSTTGESAAAAMRRGPTGCSFRERGRRRARTTAWRRWRKRSGTRRHQSHEHHHAGVNSCPTNEKPLLARSRSIAIARVFHETLANRLIEVGPAVAQDCASLRRSTHRASVARSDETNSGRGPSSRWVAGVRTRAASRTRQPENRARSQQTLAA